MAEVLQGGVRLKLAAKTRLRYDTVRGQHMLLMPERAVVLNESAAAILSLVDGERTVDDIVRELTERFTGADLRQDVLEFLAGFYREGWVVLA